MTAVSLIAIVLSSLAVGALIGYNLRKKPVLDSPVSDRLCDVIERQSSQIVSSHSSICDQLSIHQDHQLDRINARHLADSVTSSAVYDDGADANYLYQEPTHDSDLPTEIP